MCTSSRAPVGCFKRTDPSPIKEKPTWAMACEDRARKSDPIPYGVFARARSQVTNNLRLGPVFGAFTRLEGKGLSAFSRTMPD